MSLYFCEILIGAGSLDDEFDRPAAAAPPEAARGARRDLGAGDLAQLRLQLLLRPAAGSMSRSESVLEPADGD